MKRRAIASALAAILAVVGSGTASASDPATETVHVVGEGETLNGIANRAGVPRDRIIEANGLEAPFLIRIGQKLKIPRAKSAAASSTRISGTEHIVGLGETLSGIAERAGVGQSRIIAANGLEPPYLIRVGQKLTIPRGSAASAAPAAAQPAPPVASSPSLESSTEHIVEEGETLGGIANRTGVPRVLIAEANGLTEPYVIRVGQKLKIPRTRRHTVKDGDTGFSIAYTYGVSWNDIAVASGIDPEAPIKTGQELLIPTIINRPAPVSAPAPAPSPSPAAQPATRFLWPLSGSVRRGFYPRGQSDYHDGLDIQAPRGTAVRATAEGKVIFAGDRGDFGNLVILAHGDGWHSVYGYLSRITVVLGEQVNQGERIGLAGNTGIAKGDELHFELRRDNKPVDPKTELPEGP